MPDNQWIDNMKRIMLQAVEAGDPCDLLPGTVVSASPAAVQIDQKTTVKGGQVLVPPAAHGSHRDDGDPGVGRGVRDGKKWIKTGRAGASVTEKRWPAISCVGPLVERRCRRAAGYR